MKIQYLQSIKETTGIDDLTLTVFLQNFDRQIIKKKTKLLKAGAVAAEIFIIVNGCMRLYYEKDGEDLSAYFFTEGMFAGAYDSFISQKPSSHYIEALEECEVLAISYKRFTKLLKEFPIMNEFIRKILEERFIALHELFTSHILDSPEERYIKLLEYRPDLLQRVPQHQIATFLGVTPVSLSRIRHRVTKK